MANMTEQQAMLLKSNSIHYYMNNQSNHVFVYNNTAEFDKNKRLSNIIIPLKGDNLSIRVYATKLPIDLTEQAPKNEIITNQYFMRQLKNRNILICPDDEAFAKLATQEAAAELENQRKANENIKRETLAMHTDIEVDDQAHLLDNKTDVSTIDNPDLIANPTVMDCISREELSDNEKLTILNNVENLTVEDYNFILKSTKSESIKEFAVKGLEKLNVA